MSLFAASKLGPLTEDESFLPEDHWAEEGLNIITDGYYTGDEDLSIKMQIFWGVRKID